MGSVRVSFFIRLDLPDCCQRRSNSLLLLITYKWPMAYVGHSLREIGNNSCANARHHPDYGCFTYTFGVTSMKWTFQLRGRDISYTVVEGVGGGQAGPGVAGESEESFRDGFTVMRPRKTIARAGSLGWLCHRGTVGCFRKGRRVFVETREPLHLAAIERSQYADAGCPPGAPRSLGGHASRDRSGNGAARPRVFRVQAQQALKGDKLILVRRLSFAANTFQVRVPGKRPLAEVIHVSCRARRPTIALPSRGI